MSEVRPNATTPTTSVATASTRKIRWHFDYMPFSKPWQNLAALVATVVGVMTVYYQVKSFSLTAWTAQKDYREFCRNFRGNKTDTFDCPIESPPVLKLKRWWQQAGHPFWSHSNMHPDEIYLQGPMLLLLLMTFAVSVFMLWDLLQRKQFAKDTFQPDEYAVQRARFIAGQLLSTASIPSCATSPIENEPTSIRRRSFPPADGSDLLHASKTSYKLSIKRPIPPGPVTMLLERLINDPFVKELCSVGNPIAIAERFDMCFSKLIQAYIDDLALDARTSAEKAAVALVNSIISDQIHTEIRQRITTLDPPTSGSSTVLQRVRLADFLLHSWCESHELSRRRPQWDSVTQFLTESRAFWRLRDDFRRSLFPTAWTVYREALGDIIFYNRQKTIAAGTPLNEVFDRSLSSFPLEIPI